MDLNWYYIIPSHYPKSYRILIVGFIICVLMSVLGWVFRNKSRIWNNMAGVSWMVLWGYTAVVFTMLGRWQSYEPQLELHLFWCIREAWVNHDALDWYFIVGNILLFVPLGCILTLYFARMRNWWKIVLAGFGASAIIEVAQLVLHVGLFELDDLFHNTLGCYLGYCLCTILLCITRKDEWKDRKMDCLISVVSWIVVCLFFGISAGLGQPVFEKFFVVMVRKI